MKSLTTLLAVLLSFSVVNNVYGADNKYMKAVCKVASTHGAGTGFVINEDDHYFYVLTAAHVILEAPDPISGLRNKPHKQLWVQFYRNNKESTLYAAQLVWWYFDWPKLEDAAIIAVDKSLVAEKDTPVPWLLHHEELEITVGVVRSIGLPGTRWPMRWTAEIINVLKEQNELFISFDAIPGQSGSPLVQNSQIVGIVLRTDGGACDINKIRSLIQENNETLFTYLFKGTKSDLQSILKGSKFAEPVYSTVDT